MVPIFLITLKESVRKRIVLVALILTAIFLALYGTGVHYGYKDMVRHGGEMKALIAPMFLTLGLYFGSFIIAFLAVMTAVGAVSAEVENGTMHAVVTRPVRRAEIILGKFLGYSFILSLFSALFYVAVLLIVHYSTGLSVPVKAKAVLLFCLQSLILLSVTMFGTTFLSTLANGIGAFMLYSVGVVGGMLEQFGYLAKSQMLVNIGIVSSLIMPADSVYRKIVYTLSSAPGSIMTLYMGPFGSGAEPSAWMMAYTVLYVLFFLIIALKIFSRRDI